MMGAIAVAFIPFQKAVRQPHPQTFYGEAIQLPKNTKIDRKLILGSLLFGIGWELRKFVLRRVLLDWTGLLSSDLFYNCDVRWCAATS